VNGLDPWLPWWGFSTLDSRTHLLLPRIGHHFLRGVVKAKCGHYFVEASTTVHAEPPLSGRCPQCQLIHTRQWVISPYDLTEHLLCAVQPTRFELSTRCGHQLPVGAARPHPVPVLRTICPTCAAHAVVNAKSGRTAASLRRSPRRPRLAAGLSECAPRALTP
jgi:hypothetical protein